MKKKTWIITFSTKHPALTKGHNTINDRLICKGERTFAMAYGHEYATKHNLPYGFVHLTEIL
jgi:hypothetical protein